MKFLAPDETGDKWEKQFLRRDETDDFNRNADYWAEEVLTHLITQHLKTFLGCNLFLGQVS